MNCLCQQLTFRCSFLSNTWRRHHPNFIPIFLVWAGRYPGLPLQLKETILFKYDLHKQRAEVSCTDQMNQPPSLLLVGLSKSHMSPFQMIWKKKAKILALRKENGGRRREVEAFCGMTKIHAKKKKPDKILIQISNYSINKLRLISTIPGTEHFFSNCWLGTISKFWNQFSR